MNEAWTWRPLGELFEIGAGKTMSATARNGANKTPFLRTSNVLWDEIDLSSVDEMSISERELPGKLLRRGDLLVCEGGAIGRAAIWGGTVETMSFQNHVHRLRPVAPNVEPRFYVFFLQSAFTQLGIYEGAGNKTTIPNLSRSRLAGLDVPQPPLAEQQAIIHVLGRVRDAIKLHGRSIAATQALKRAAMRRLFTRGLRGEAQKETEFGPVPESWVQVPLSALGKIVTGNTPPTEDPGNYIAGEIPFVAPGDFEHGFRIDKTEKLITPLGLERSRSVKAGTTCFVCIGSTIGKVGYTTFKVCATNQQINSIVPNSGFDPLFTFYLMVYWAEHIHKRASPSPVPILSKGAFAQIEVVGTTDLEEQRETAAVLNAIDDKIDLHRRKRAALAELFQVLLHKMMSGKVHVGELGIPVSYDDTGAVTEADEPIGNGV